METLPYRILYEGKVIAQFREGCDRAICLDALEAEFDDCVFTTEEER